MTTDPTHLHSDFFSAKSLFTLSGSAGAVWLFCLVLSAVIPPDSLSIYGWRLIAITCSELLAIVILLQSKPDSFSKWLVALFNGLLIFINASGINAVSTGLAFSNKNNNQHSITGYNVHQKLNYAAFFPFGHETNWWPDNALIQKNESLQKTIIQLNNSNGHLKSSIDTLEKNCASKTVSVAKEPIKNSNGKEDSLLRIQLVKLKCEIALLTKTTIVNINKSQVSETPNSASQSLNQQLSECQKENLEMMLKLSKIKKLNELLKEADKYNL